MSYLGTSILLREARSCISDVVSLVSHGPVVFVTSLTSKLPLAKDHPNTLQDVLQPLSTTILRTTSYSTLLQNLYTQHSGRRVSNTLDLHLSTTFL